MKILSSGRGHAEVLKIRPLGRVLSDVLVKAGQHYLVLLAVKTDTSFPMAATRKLVPLPPPGVHFNIGR